MTITPRRLAVAALVAALALATFLIGRLTVTGPCDAWKRERRTAITALLAHEISDAAYLAVADARPKGCAL